MVILLLSPFLWLVSILAMGWGPLILLSLDLLLLSFLTVRIMCTGGRDSIPINLLIRLRWHSAAADLLDRMLLYLRTRRTTPTILRLRSFVRRRRLFHWMRVIILSGQI